FLQYFIPSLLLITIMLNRNVVLQYLLVVMKSFFESAQKLVIDSETLLSRKIAALSEQEFVYFSKADDISSLNKAIMYVQNNEITNKLRIVTVINDHKKVS